MSQNVLLVKAISLLGGVWFLYGGGRLIFMGKTSQLTQAVTVDGLQFRIAYRLGLTAGVSDVQAIIFFSTMFAVAISSTPDLHGAIVLVAGIALVSMIARCSIVSVFTTKMAINFYVAQQRRMKMFFGGVLALFGAKLAGPAAVILARTVL